MLDNDFTIEQIRVILQFVNNKFYKIILGRNINLMDSDPPITGGEKKTKEQIQQELGEVKKHQEQVESLNDDREKADYIIALEDNDQKLYFLDFVSDREQRLRIIESMKHNVGEEFLDIVLDDGKDVVSTAQEMILDFLKDVIFNGEIPQEVYEKILIVYNRTNVNGVEFPDFNTHGKTYHIYSALEVNSTMANNKKILKLLDILIHEYGHLFAQFDYFYKYDEIALFFEEGMMDTFMEMVINHWLMKKQEKYTYITDSSYINNRGWIKLILCILQFSNKDKGALIEYLFGDKDKFFAMIMKEDKIESFKQDYYLTFEDLYEHFGYEMDFFKKSPDYYMLHNDVYSDYWLFFNERRQTEISLKESRSIDEIFEGRELYEISREKFEELLRSYLDKYDDSIVIGILVKYLESKINNNTENIELNENYKKHATDILLNCIPFIKKISSYNPWFNPMRKIIDLVIDIQKQDVSYDEKLHAEIQQLEGTDDSSINYLLEILDVKREIQNSSKDWQEFFEERSRTYSFLHYIIDKKYFEGKKLSQIDSSKCDELITMLREYGDSVDIENWIRRYMEYKIDESDKTQLEDDAITVLQNCLPFIVYIETNFPKKEKDENKWQYKIIQNALKKLKSSSDSGEYKALYDFLSTRLKGINSNSIYIKMLQDIANILERWNNK